MAIRSARYLTGRDVITGKALGIGEMEYNVLKKDEVQTHQLYNEHFFSGLKIPKGVSKLVSCRDNS